MNRVGWESPSNIALIKYWGKHGIQLPNNPSISFTLSRAATRTFVSYEEGNKTGKVNLTFLFENQENKAFQSRLEAFLNSIVDEYFPFLKDISLHIESSNSFPHSSGIASSASSMSALALSICSLEQIVTQTQFEENWFYQKASIISRLGSGSACRSLFPSVGLWGFNPSIPNSSDNYAIGLQDEIAPVFKTFHDDILIVSPNEKSVSSSAGHSLMNGNPYAKPRYEQANHRLIELLEALKMGDLPTFGKITEDEALTLHALMMCSDPSFILMEPNSLLIIKKIQEFRKDTRLPIYFTLDAGPNVHVLYPDENEREIKLFIQNELKPWCHDGKIIQDMVGNGPHKIC